MSATPTLSIVTTLYRSSSTIEEFVSRDGTEVGSGAVYVPPVATRTLNYIGKSYWGADGAFEGDIAEIILYDRELSGSEQEAVRSYLADKYGI